MLAIRTFSNSSCRHPQAMLGAMLRTLSPALVARLAMPLVGVALGATASLAQSAWVLVRPPLDEARLAALAADPAFQASPPDAQAAAVIALAVEPTAPLARWQRWVEYESESACRGGRAELEARARRGLRELGSFVPGSAKAAQARHNVRIEAEIEIRRFQDARCVPASQAPR